MQNNQSVEGLQSLDQRQRFDEIEIESDNESIKLNQVNLQQAMTRVQELINQKATSSFYKNITVHLGAKTKQKVNYLQEHYQQKLQVLQLALEDEKLLLKKVIEATSEDDLNFIEIEHQLNQQYIKRKQNQVKQQDFIPCIYIQTQKKKPLFGTITQEFSRKGMGNFVAKLGYRSPFLKYDKIEFNFQWPISSLRRSYYQVGAEWTNPISDTNTSSLRLNAARESTFKDIDSQISSLSWGISKEDQRYDIQYGYRSPFAQSNIQQAIKNQFYRSSRKFSLKYSRFFQNSIRFQQVAVGKYSELKSQLSLPLLGGQAKFLKLQYNFRKFFDTYKARSWFNNQFIQKLFWKSTIETNFSATAIAEYGRHHFLNDVLDSIDIRGFQTYRKPTPSYLNTKGSVKFNIHNYPLLKEGGIVAFIYSQIGFAFLKSQSLKPYTLSSCGLGLAFYAGPFTQIELLCNLAQWQSKPLRQPLNFQIRFGIFD